jgi:hypothetical protein
VHDRARAEVARLGGGGDGRPEKTAAANFPFVPRPGGSHREALVAVLVEERVEQRAIVGSTALERRVDASRGGPPRRSRLSLAASVRGVVGDAGREEGSVFSFFLLLASLRGADLRPGVRLERRRRRHQAHERRGFARSAVLRRDLRAVEPGVVEHPGV